MSEPRILLEEKAAAAAPDVQIDIPAAPSCPRARRPASTMSEPRILLEEKAAAAALDVQIDIPAAPGEIEMAEVQGGNGAGDRELLKLKATAEILAVADRIRLDDEAAASVAAEAKEKTRPVGKSRVAFINYRVRRRNLLRYQKFADHRSFLGLWSGLMMAGAVTLLSNPPKGFWQEDTKDHFAGVPILLSKFVSSYGVFVFSLTMAFLSSFLVLLCLLFEKLHGSKVCVKSLTAIAAISGFLFTTAYLVSAFPQRPLWDGFFYCLYAIALCGTVFLAIWIYRKSSVKKRLWAS